MPDMEALMLDYAADTGHNEYAFNDAVNWLKRKGYTVAKLGRSVQLIVDDVGYDGAIVCEGCDGDCDAHFPILEEL